MNYPQLERAINIVEKLRDPENGCPWDIKQTHQSLLQYLIEESYEYLHSVELGDQKLMMEELGDVLLQVLLHSTVAKQEQSFDLEDVARSLADKLIYRHPHVFKNPQDGLTPEDVLKRWEELCSSKRSIFL